MFLIPEDIVHNLVIERSVREIRPTREHWMGNIDRSRVPQSRLATVHDIRSVNSVVILDLERVYANLGLEEAGETCAGED